MLVTMKVPLTGVSVETSIKSRLEEAALRSDSDLGDVIARLVERELAPHQDLSEPLTLADLSLDEAIIARQVEGLASEGSVAPEALPGARFATIDREYRFVELGWEP